MVSTMSTSDNLGDKFAVKLEYRKECADMEPSFALSHLF